MGKYKKNLYVYLFVCIFLIFLFLYLSFGQKWGLIIRENLDLIWKDFWEMEMFRQFSIQQRYGVFIRGVSIIVYGYIAFILISLGILLLKKGKGKFKLIFYVGLGLILFVGIRNAITYSLNLGEGLSQFKSDKIYFEFGDYYSFVDKVRDRLDLDFNKKNDCKFSLEYNSTFVHGPLDVYFKPCELDLLGDSPNYRFCEFALPGDVVDYKIYYKKEIPEEDLDKKVLLEFNGSYLLENKSN